jgi:1-acyl-sn-glycerol-3-phosphate acyltransferase
MARALRGIRVGAPYRTAEAILWPTMMALTRRDWRGQENLGKHGQGMVVAFNHISWFDPVVVLHFMHDSGRPPRLLAKDSLWDVRVLGPLMQSTGQIPVSRDADPSKALAAAEEAIRGGEAIIVYPEGTITRDPGLWPMSGRTGALRLALETEAPLIPVAQWGAQRIMAPYTKELKLLPPKLVQVTAGPPVPIDDLRGRPITKDLLDEGTNRLMDAITGILEGLRGEQAPEQRLDWAAERARRTEPTTKEEI